MIKNIIFDVGMVLVNWDPHAAFQELGFDEKTEEAVGNATVYSDAWNESDRSVLDAEEQILLYLSKMRRNMKKRSACSGKMLHGQFISTIIRAHGSGS